jgi:branched-chain amino acid transport system ATP-binding protein
MSLLEVENLHVRYGEVPALQGVSLRLDKGELVAILGANGSGKTTLLRAISGLLQPVEGRIVFADENLQRLPVHEIVGRGINHVVEGRGILGELTVAENMRLGMYLRGVRRAREDLDWVLGLFPVLRERYKETAGMLSGGEQQMLSIARSLIGRPRLLMIDELSLGLSPKISSELMRALVGISREGVAVAIVEQSAHQALKFADRVYVLSNGATVHDGTSAQVAGNPALLEAYLGRD